MFLLGKGHERLWGQEIGSVINEVKLPTGHLCGVIQSALGSMDMDHLRVARMGVRARDKD